MPVATGIEDLKVTNVQDARSVHATGTLVRLTHTFLVKEKTESAVPGQGHKHAQVEPKERKVTRILHGEIKGLRYDTAIELDPSIVRTPTIAYHIGEVLLESHDGEPRFEQYNDIIVHASDPKYTIEAVLPVLH